MKVIAVNASPCKGGNTAFVMDTILKGAREQGAETQLFDCSDLDIKPCRGCLGCQRSGKGCIIDDDMQRLYDALAEADALVLGSPVYMGQMSGQAKVFTDRLFAQIHPRFSPQFQERHAGKKLALVFTQGNPNPEMFKAYYDYTKAMFGLLEFEVKDVCVAIGMRKEAAKEQRDLHDAWKRCGAALVSE